MHHNEHMILVASDAFKGTIGSLEVAQSLRGPCEEAGFPVTVLPLADGGEGTVDALVTCGYEAHQVEVTGPLGQPVTARWASLCDTAEVAAGSATSGTQGGAAVIEMAQASGLHPVDPSPQTAWDAHTYGTGELIAHAIEYGCTRVVVGVGGSATSDGGRGALRAVKEAGVDTSGVAFTVACDVDNPLTGPRGAAQVFGPQKGADRATVARLEERLARWADQLDPTGRVRDLPGAGAAGGLGFALMAGLGADRVSGAEFVLSAVGFDEQLARASVVVTGEGQFDEQTLGGKGPGTVIARAGEAGVPVIVVCGQARLRAGDVSAGSAGQAGPVGAEVAEVFALTDFAPVQQCVAEPGRVLKEVGYALAATVRDRGSCGGTSQ